MTQHIVTAAAVKVSIGAAGGNRVASLLRRGDVVPDGIDEDQLKRLASRKLIAPNKTASSKAQVEVPDGDPTETWTVAQLELFAKGNEIDLGEAKTKLEKLELILAALAAD